MKKLLVLLLGFLLLAGCAAPAAPASAPTTAAPPVAEITAPSPLPTPTPMPISSSSPTPSSASADNQSVTSYYKNLSFEHDNKYTYTDNDFLGDYSENRATLVYDGRDAFVLFGCHELSGDDDITDTLVKVFHSAMIDTYDPTEKSDFTDDIAGRDALLSTFQLNIGGTDYVSVHASFADTAYIYNLGFFCVPDADYIEEFQNLLYSVEISATDADTGAITESDSEPADTMSTSQRNAISKAEEYLDYSAFSKEGLAEQLEYEGFSSDDAEYAVDQLSTDWNEQAVKKAEEYIDYSAFSKSGLIEQLEYEGFTDDEAEYGVEQLSIDWNEQAAKKAEEYMEYSSFSRRSLIDQLEYEGFTREQAEHGAAAVG